MANVKEKERFKSFKDEKMTDFLKKNNSVISQLDKSEKIKLCSSDDFSTVANTFYDKYFKQNPPTIISHVGGFYVTASIGGIAASICKGKPSILFFDRKTNNIQNALYNTLLIGICPSKERYLTTLFGLDDIEIVKTLNPNLYLSYLEDIVAHEYDFTGLSKQDKIAILKELYSEDKEAIDKKIKAKYLNQETMNIILKSSFNLSKIVKYAQKRGYNSEKHLEYLNEISKNLGKELREIFNILSKNMTEYLSLKDNYQDLLRYLNNDIKLNEKYHMLTNDYIYNGYKSLTTKKGMGNVKFISGIDISQEKGLKKLEEVLKTEGFISDSLEKDKFPIDIAFIPHILNLKIAYPFIKHNVQNYIMLSKDKKKNYFSSNSTATLEQRTYSSIGASFIEEERLSRKPLTNLSKIESKKGFPLMTFIAGANYGNIYHSEVDTQNMIDMAISDHVDTVYIGGLIYSTYFHSQTSRRLLIDPMYESLDSRLKAAHKIIKRLNDNGIKVVYQMGDEELHLYNDMFKVYVREQGVIGNDFLKREDLRSKFDWVRPIILQQLIPYLIRSGEDVTNFYTDDAKETRVSVLCHALKLFNEGLPLGDLAKYVKPEYLKDNDMFKVVYAITDGFSKDDPALAIKLLNNPNYSYLTQYGKPNAGISKRLNIFQTGAVRKDNIPELFVDAREGFQSLSYRGAQAVLNVPQMIDDSYYLNHDELLPGIKEHITEDPTHKRVTQIQTKPNFPGGWTITGDLREVMSIIPYYRRVKEVMDYVQKTGEALPNLSVFHLNDTQIGSPTERIEYMLKSIDYFLYNYQDARGIWGNGDFQQGWNYAEFAQESRHLGSMSVSHQMVDFVKLERPWIQESFGVVKDDLFVDENNDFKIDSLLSKKIINHLANENVINHNCGLYQNVNSIKKDIDYQKIDLKLSLELKRYEKLIREKLANVKSLWFYHLVEGNHEHNSDWNNKGYRLIEHLKQELNNLKEYTGSDMEVLLTEYFVNQNGDFVNAPYGCKTINGYNIVYGHSFKAKGVGSGGSPTMAMANYFDQMGSLSNRIDRAFMGHLHIFETSVINNKLLSITGASAGQSGYEQNLGYSSKPLFVIDRYLSDGRIQIDTIGTDFLDNYEIQNPYVRAKGLDNFISECLTEKAPLYAFEEPKNIHDIHQRKLIAKKPNEIIGPKI